MSSLYKSFKTNSAKENKGVPIRYSANEQGKEPTFWVARISKANKKYQKVTKELYKPYRREIQLGSMKDEVAEQLLRTAFIRGCLRNWENIEDSEGVELPFSFENAEMLFSELPDLLENLMDQANNITLYQDEELEDDVKNS